MDEKELMTQLSVTGAERLRPYGASLMLDHRNGPRQEKRLKSC